MKTNVTAKERKIIREYAQDNDCKYRVRSEGGIDFYGTMPNSNEVGWFFVAHDFEDFEKKFINGDAFIGKGEENVWNYNR